MPQTDIAARTVLELDMNDSKIELTPPFYSKETTEQIQYNTMTGTGS
jgi:hypothetical protein